MITAVIYALVFVLAFPTLADAECPGVLWLDDGSGSTMSGGVPAAEHESPS